MVDFSLRAGPLDIQDAFHLLRRATLRPSYTAAQALVGKTAAEAVFILMSANTPADKPSWASDPLKIGDMNEAARLWGELQRWWMRQALEVTSVKERMVLFWQNTFTSDYLTVYYSQFMVKQAHLFRTVGYDARAIALAMIGDPAMLIYLNGASSIKGSPNENFAREWFELFTLGVGNYTEHDIVDAARAFTGWRIVGLDGVYNRQLHDVDEKTILGHTGAWDYQDVHRFTFDTPACATFYARKLYRTFVASEPTEEALSVIAGWVKQYNFDLNPVLGKLLASSHFYEPAVRGALIKSPAELVVGLASTLNASSVHSQLAVNAMTKLNMEPFYPPTVEGWKGHHAWINSTTFPLRQRWAEAFVDGKDAASSQALYDDVGMPLPVSLVAFARQMPDAGDPRKLVTNIATALLPIPLTTEQHAVLLSIMLAGAPEYEWDVESPSAPNRLKFLVQAIVRMPEFQLT